MISLQHSKDKLIKLTQFVQKNDFIALKVDKEDFERLIQVEMIRMISDEMIKRIIFKTIPQQDGDFTIEGSGFFFTEKEFYSLVNEICELSEADRLELEELAKSKI